MTNEDFLKTIPSMEQIYVIYSNLTHLPYVIHTTDPSEEMILIYENEEKAQAKAKELTDEKRSSAVIKVEPRMIYKKLSEYHSFGITAVQFESNEDTATLKLSAIAKRHDYSKQPVDKRPLMNPGLQLNGIYCMQELRRQLPDADKQMINSLYEDMILYMLHSRFLIPYVLVNRDGKQYLDPPVLKMANGKQVIPVFSDATSYTEFAHMNKQNFKPHYIDFEKMSQVPFKGELSAFIVNPLGISVVLEQELIKKVVADFSED